MGSLRIGQLAREAGIGVETVRFYERRGLLDEPPRRASGYREYAAESADRLRFIRRAKGLGFSLNEIRDLLALHADSAGACRDVYARAQAKLADIETRIVALRAVGRALQRLARACEENEPLAACPLLRALGGKDGA